MGDRGMWRTVSFEAVLLLIVAIFLWHGVPKAFDPASAVAKFEGWGLPGLLGPLTGWVEVVAVGLLFYGPTFRAATSVLAVIIVGALVTVQIPGGVSAGLERDLLILTSLTLLYVRGPGALAFGGHERDAV